MKSDKRPGVFRQRYPIIYNIVLIALIVLALALAAAAAMHFGTRHGSHSTVPDFSGLKLAQAQAEAHRTGLEIIVNDSLYVPVYEGGIVLDQLPKGGVEVKRGRKVYVTINSHSQKMVRVPYVAGRSLRQAKNMLEVAGLEIARLVYVEDIATNYVLEEFCDDVQILPESTMQAEMGSGITLHVGVQGGYGTTDAPRLLGLSLARAKSRIWEMGLNVGTVSYDDGVEVLDRNDARVWYQSFEQGMPVPLGSNVNLRLTLDAEKVEGSIAAANAAEQARLEERLAREAEADSLRALAGSAAVPEGDIMRTQTEDEFFQ